MDVFAPLHQLHTLKLNKNQLTDLALEIFQPLKLLDYLDVRNNPLECSCDLYNVFKTLMFSAPWHFSLFPGQCDGIVNLHMLVHNTPEKVARKQLCLT